GEVLDRALEVDGVQVRAAFIKVGDHMMIELIEHQAQDPQPFTLRNCDVGAMHVGFDVDDIHAVHDQLKEKGVHINAEPVQLDGTGGRLDGLWFCYFRDPDGLQLELIQG
ncbi:MAG TPA: VOC family protein, partial [Solirubrobacterales bacterium]